MKLTVSTLQKLMGVLIGITMLFTVIQAPITSSITLTTLDPALPRLHVSSVAASDGPIFTPGSYFIMTNTSGTTYETFILSRNNTWWTVNCTFEEDSPFIAYVNRTAEAESHDYHDFYPAVGYKGIDGSDADHFDMWGDPTTLTLGEDWTFVIPTNPLAEGSLTLSGLGTFEIWRLSIDLGFGLSYEQQIDKATGLMLRSAYLLNSVPLWQINVTTMHFNHFPSMPSITSPTAASAWGIGTHTVEWTSATDSDYDTLTYSLYYRSGSGAWTPISGGLGLDNDTVSFNWDTSSLPDNSNYQVNVTTSDGYTINSSVSDYFIIDNSPPNINLEFPTNGSAYKPGAIIDLDIIADDDLSTVLANWDSNDNETLEPPYDLTLPESVGFHSLEVFAGDTRDNWVRAYFEFITDITAPDIRLISTQNNTDHPLGTVIGFEIYDDDLDLVLAHWDDDEPSVLVSPFWFEIPNVIGEHHLYIEANDSLDNVKAIHYVFYTNSSALDTVAPLFHITSPINNTFYSSASVLLQYLLSEEDTTDSVFINGSLNSTLHNGSTVGEGDGLYNLTLVALDLAGNVGSSTSMFTIDTINPLISIDSPINQTYATSNIQIALSGDASNYWYIFVNEDSSNRTWNQNVTLNLDDGVFCLQAFGNDTAGNIGHTQVTFTVDTTPPNISILSPLEGTDYPETTILLNISVNERALLWYSMVGVNSTPTIPSLNLTVTVEIEEGDWEILFYAQDLVGNNASETISFTIYLGSFNKSYTVEANKPDWTFRGIDPQRKHWFDVAILANQKTSMKANLFEKNPTDNNLAEAVFFFKIWLNNSSVLTLLTLKVQVAELTLPSALDFEDLTIFWYDPEVNQWAEVPGTFLFGNQLEAQLSSVGFFAVARGSEEATTAPLPILTPWNLIPFLIMSLLGIGIFRWKRKNNREMRKKME